MTVSTSGVPSPSPSAPKGLRLAAVAIVRDEADVIEAFVRHNLAVVDHLFIEDDHSRDGTRAILDALAAEGLAVSVFDGPQEAAYFQAARTKGLLQRAYAVERWDFAFLLDGDEFLTTLDRATLEAELASLPESQAGGLRMWNYLPRPLDETSDPFSFFSDRTQKLTGFSAKVMLPASVAANEELKIEDGNHAAFCFRRKVVVHQLQSVALAHFPVRSHDQIVSKTLVAYCRWRTRPDYDPATTALGPMGAMALLRANPGLRLDSLDAITACYMGATGPDDTVQRPFERLGAARRYDGLAAIRPYDKAASAVDTIIASLSHLEAGGAASRPAAESGLAKFLSKSLVGRWRALRGGHTTLKAEWDGTVRRLSRSIRKRLG
ncbi:glycosyltransferase family 2 protein [Xanthobacter autotrophicus]|uniref:glycosyltransferase family 2 protein n=1 Tax=Xanthobacter autotrophicus TaxID=280 RepID=UPI00372BB55A